eukprot:1423631-Rhodomonas_salina.1
MCSGCVRFGALFLSGTNLPDFGTKLPERKPLKPFNGCLFTLLCHCASVLTLLGVWFSTR